MSNNDDLQQKYNSLVREYSKLMDENRKLKGEKNYTELTGTHLNSKGYLKMNETKDDLKIQVKVILVFIVICISGMVFGTYIFDATTYTFTGIGVFCFFLWCFIGCARVANKLYKQLQGKE